MPLNSDQTLFLYLVDLNQPEFNQAQLRNILNDTEIERFEKFKSSVRRKQFAVARWLIKKVLRDKFQIPLTHQYQLQDFRYWVCVETNRQFTVSISHSKDIVAVLVTQALINIGIDVEYHKNRNYIELAKVFANENDINALHQSVTKGADFYKLWTAKEAFYKATGTDLSSSSATASSKSDDMYFYYWSIKQNSYSLSVCSQVDQTIFVHEDQEVT